MIPLLSALLTALLGILTYAWQEWIKRKNAIAERRKNLYESWIINLVELLAARTEQERSRLISEVEKGWLFASDEVLQAAYSYLEIYDEICYSHTEAGHLEYKDVLDTLRENKEVRQRIGHPLAKIFLAMRQDIRSDSKISEEWALQNFEIYEWGIISTGQEQSNR